MTLPDDLRWYREHQDAPPIKMHRSAVWADRADGAGSYLGSPDWTDAFDRWLTAGDRATVVVEVETRCYHAGKVTGLCTVCSVRDEHGNPIVETGVRKATVERYRTPMRATLRQMRSQPVGLPSDAHALGLLAATGSVSEAASLLSVRYPRFVASRFAYGFFAAALRRCRTLYAEQVPFDRVRTWVDKSDSQRAAERHG